MEPNTIPARLVAFARELRRQGVDVTPGRTLDAARSLQLVDSTDRAAFRAALRSNLTISLSEYHRFDQAFDAFWGTGRAQGFAGTPVTDAIRPPPARQEGQGGPAVYERQLVEFGARPQDEALLPGGEGSAGDRDLLTRKDFADFDASDVRRARRLAARLRPALATVPGRRLRPSATGDRIDLRASVRAAHRHGGEVLRLARQERRRQRLRVVALCDVSGSMDRYAPHLLEFLYGLQSQPGSVRCFVFSTRLREVTSLLAATTIEEALARLGRGVDLWSAGTSIGACLAQFNRQHGLTLVNPRTVIIIASDGWERGDPEHLRREMALLSRRAYRIIWLNPLKGHTGYRPLARGMTAALPYIDYFLPAHNLAALESMGRVLTGLS